MADSAQKLQFLQQAQNLANAMATLDAQIKDAGNLLVNNGWNAAGSDPITAADIPPDIGFTVADATAFFTTAGKFNTLMNGLAVTADPNTRMNIDRFRSSFKIGNGNG
jgi:hypothetical protein